MYRPDEPTVYGIQVILNDITLFQTLKLSWRRLSEFSWESARSLEVSTEAKLAENFRLFPKIISALNLSSEDDQSLMEAIRRISNIIDRLQRIAQRHIRKDLGEKEVDNTNENIGSIITTFHGNNAHGNLRISIRKLPRFVYKQLTIFNKFFSSSCD